MPSIRNIAVGLPIRNGHVLVSDGEEIASGRQFHRAIGGGIEFGETAEAALRREFVEELGMTLGRVELLAVIENLFVYENSPGHEIVHVFHVESPELDRIPLEARLHILDEGSPVGWVPIRSADRPIYPQGVAELAGRHEFTLRAAASDHGLSEQEAQALASRIRDETGLAVAVESNEPWFTVVVTKVITDKGNDVFTLWDEDDWRWLEDRIRS